MGTNETYISGQLYADFLASIRDPEDTGHDEYLDWVGGNFDPDAFDLENTNAALRMIK